MHTKQFCWFFFLRSHRSGVTLSYIVFGCDHFTINVSQKLNWRTFKIIFETSKFLSKISENSACPISASSNIWERLQHRFTGVFIQHMEDKFFFEDDNSIKPTNTFSLFRESQRTNEMLPEDGSSNIDFTIFSKTILQLYYYIIIIIASRRWLKQHNFAIFKTLLCKNFYQLIFRREIIYNLFSLFRESLSIWMLCFQMMAQAGKQKTAYTSTEEENSVEISK